AHAPAAHVEGHGELPEHHGESLTMAIPLIILTIPTIISGFWGMPFIGNPFARFIEGPAEAAAVRAPEAAFNPLIAGISVVVALVGIGLAWAMYGGGKTQPG